MTIVKRVSAFPQISGNHQLSAFINPYRNFEYTISILVLLTFRVTTQNDQYDKASSLFPFPF